MARKTQIVNDQYYHIYNRGVDKRRIFMEDKHYYRFIHGLYEFNDSDTINNLNWRFNNNYGFPKPIVEKKKRKRLVDILCFCLMPTHFHLILKQLIDKGISKFMQKLGAGYANYFNEVQKRTGAFFEGRFKSILIENDEYLMSLSRYIHLNCVDLVEPKWHETGIKNLEAAKQFLENYKWSSYLDYIGKKNVPSVINPEFILSYFKGKKEYCKFTNDWMESDMCRNSRRPIQGHPACGADLERFHKIIERKLPSPVSNV